MSVFSSSVKLIPPSVTSQHYYLHRRVDRHTRSLRPSSVLVHPRGWGWFNRPVLGIEGPVSTSTGRRRDLDPYGRESPQVLQGERGRPRFRGRERGTGEGRGPRIKPRFNTGSYPLQRRAGPYAHESRRDCVF